MANDKKKAEEGKKETAEASQEKTKQPEKTKETKGEKEVKKEQGSEAPEKKEEVQPLVSKKIAKLIDEVGALTVLELADLVEALENKFGVRVASMVAPAAPAQAGTSTAEGTAPAEGKDRFTVVLTNAGSQKIQVIKALREIDQSLGLKEAKDKTESTPTEVLVDAKKENAETAKKALEEAGGTVELK